jgi:type I restriction enzyme, S subunit
MKKIQQTIPKGWKEKKISELLDYERPDNYIVKDTNYNDSYSIPVLTANKGFILGYTNEKIGICNDLPVIIFDDFTTDSKYVDFPFKIKSSAIKILRPQNKDINLRYVYEKMRTIKFPLGNHKRYYISEYQNLDVVIPSFSEQTKIAEILLLIDNNIDIYKQINDKLTELKKGVMQDLLSGDVRV